MAQLSTAFKSGQVYSSRQTSFKGNQSGLQMPKCSAVVVMRKKGIHPEWHDEAKVMCNGEEVLVTSGTQASYTVDIWSGNHPYYQGITTSVVTDEGRVNKFKRRFAGLDSLSAVNTMASLQKEKDDAAAAQK
ncbi:putative 50S ribosomal protein L31, chloroplastic [Nannochloris sp. 'desiccata']|nr:hypothetical protein KSW81_000954 [Chlorella desiccata (nom. nud.)]KAH7620361.1 putative 50S ribosomal protein L31, chloroplastic [Chlorella desiccata (nom. nud.)]